MKFGRLPKLNDFRTLRFSTYSQALEQPPAQWESLLRVCENTWSNCGSLGTLFPMDGNDQYGDCVVAAVAHMITVWRGFIGLRDIPSLNDVVAYYFRLTGGADKGLAMLPVLRDLDKNGFDGENIEAYVAIDPRNHTHVKQAIKEFGLVNAGFQCTKNTIDEFLNKKPWQPGPLINAGHAVAVTGYNSDVVNTLTWGSSQTGTWGWWDDAVDECYAIVPLEARKKGFCPGFDFARLKADLQKIRA